MDICSARWYALQIQPKHEDMVSSLLRYKGYEEYVPEYPAAARKEKKSGPARKLFPGYVFCRFDYNASSCIGSGTGVVSTPGVVRIVGGRPPQPVADEELAAIRQALSHSLTTEPWPYLKAGQRVTIERGPLKGASGVVISSAGSRRLVISVELLQRSVAVTVAPEWVNTTAALGDAIQAAERNYQTSELLELNRS